MTNGSGQPGSRTSPPRKAGRAPHGAGDSLGTIVHPRCVACSPTNGHGLGLRFVPIAPCTVEAGFHCPCDWEGYPGIVHGGIVALILDSAMTNCLFASGHAAMTAELTVRYHAALRTGHHAVVNAAVTKSTARLHAVEAAITQDGEVKATAAGKFLMTSRSAPPDTPPV